MSSAISYDVRSLPLRRPRPAHLRPANPRLLLVANANASGLAGQREVVDGVVGALTRWGGRVEKRLTGSIDELNAVVSEEERRVVLLGGDGSLHAAANVPGAKPELALLPAGKANNVARELGIPTDLDAAARLAVHGESRAIDAIVATAGTTRYVAIEGVSVGYHALARARYRAANSADLAAGVAAAATAFARFHPVSLALESDGTLELATVGQLFVANFPLFGYGLQVAPGADPSDGLLDAVAIEVGGRAGIVPMLAHLRDGSHLERPTARRWNVRRIRIATGGRSPVIADTTNLGTGPVELTVEPGALRVVAPR